MDSISTSAPSETWQQLAGLLEQSAGSVGLTRVYPDVATKSNIPVHLSLLAGLAEVKVGVTSEHAARGEQLHEDLTGLLHQLRVFESISRCPILAVTGLLNAGKSSLLSTYLSPENRARVLTGLNNASGTHRFVLWLPKIWWDDSELLNTLISFLSGLFGHNFRNYDFNHVFSNLI